MSSIFLAAKDKLQVTTDVACAVDVVAFVDEGRVVKKITTADTVDIVVAGAPCEVESFSITNTSTTVPVTVTPVLTIDGTSYDLRGPTTLGPLQALSYTDGVGFAAPAATKLDIMRYVTADSVHATAATFATITGLTPFPVLVNHIYTFELQLFHTANAATTGAQFCISGVAATFIIGGSMSVVVPGVATTTMSSGVAAAVDTAFIVQTDSTITPTLMPTYVAGSIMPSASGDISIKATSEVSVAAGLTVKKGSWCHFRECDN